MPSFRFLALAAVAAALVVVAPAIGDSGAARGSAVPPAEVAGGDVAAALPSIVNTRLVRAQAALGRATTDYDTNQPASAVNDMGAALDNLTKGWNAAKWVVQTTPPPPTDDAFPDGTGGAGVAYADPSTTAVAVLSADHDLVSTAVGMMETSNDALLKSLTSSITTIQTQRLNAIKWIHSIEPPPPTDDAVGPDDEGASTFATLMPGYIGVLDDEIQQIKGRLALYKFSPAAKAALNNARLKALDTKDLVNQYWPPVADD
ncbi:MAG TPA: hypothetical protein VFT76_05100 [Actinomycetota bacterium]|nr:hypothetical protein [Actinomycetota bacterium]